MHLSPSPFAETICGYYEKKLLGDLMRGYDYLERPVINESEPLMLTFGITLQQIIDVVSDQRPLHEHETLNHQVAVLTFTSYAICNAEH